MGGEKRPFTITKKLIKFKRILLGELATYFFVKSTMKSLVPEAGLILLLAT
jgi:hypothetical protein